LAAKGTCESNGQKQFEKCFLKPHSHPNGFYWGHQCSWTLTPDNSMQVSINLIKNVFKQILISISQTKNGAKRFSSFPRIWFGLKVAKQRDRIQVFEMGHGALQQS